MKKNIVKTKAYALRIIKAYQFFLQEKKEFVLSIFNFQFSIFNLCVFLFLFPAIGFSQPEEEHSTEERLVNPFFTEFVYTRNFIETKVDSITVLGENPVFGQNIDLIPPSLFNDSSDLILQNIRKNAAQSMIRNDLSAIDYHISEMPDRQSMRLMQLENNMPLRVRLADAEANLFSNRLSEIPIKKRNWLGRGRASLQLSQNYISENWHSGGNSNFNLFSNLFYEYKYIGNEKIQFENNAEVRIGVTNNYGYGKDSTVLRLLSVNTNTFKIASKFGYRAAKKWYYAASAELTTQLLPSHQSPQDTILVVSFLSPYGFFLSGGMDYKPNDNLSLLLSPATFKLVGVIDTTRIDGDRHGIPKHIDNSRKFVLPEIGGSLTLKYKHIFSKTIIVDTEFKFFTNYYSFQDAKIEQDDKKKTKVEANWEIIGHFIINRFMSARVSLQTRYDNTIILPDGKKNKIQLNQLISVGFSYRF